MAVCLALFIPINELAILSSLAIAGGLYFFVSGFRLLARKRLLLTTPTSKIRSAAMGLVEVNGMAAGPYTIPAPITGKPCFLYHTTVWQQREGKNVEWDKIADETLHLPFFIDDSTGQLLVEPLGADTLVFFEISGLEMVARLPPEAARGTGDRVRLRLDLRRMHLFDPATGTRI